MADSDKRLDAVGQIDIDAAAEPDHAEPFACAVTIANLGVAKNPPGNQAGNLDKGDVETIGGGYLETLAFVELAGFVQRCIEEFSWAVSGRGDGAINGGAVYVNVEHVHEHGDARSRLRAHAKFVGRRCPVDHLHDAIGRADDQPVAHGRYPFRVAEEIDAPCGQSQTGETQGFSNPGETDGTAGEYGDERPTSTVNGDQNSF